MIHSNEDYRVTTQRTRWSNARGPESLHSSAQAGTHWHRLAALLIGGCLAACGSTSNNDDGGAGAGAAGGNGESNSSSSTEGSTDGSQSSTGGSIGTSTNSAASTTSADGGSGGDGMGGGANSVSVATTISPTTTSTASAGGSAGAGGVLLAECDVPEPCPVVYFVSGEINMPPDEDALRCVITAFRDGTPGRYTRTTTISDTFTETHYIIDTDGSVYEQPGAGGPIDRCSRLPTFEYDACLDAGTGQDFVDACNFWWVGQCSPAPYDCG